MARKLLSDNLLVVWHLGLGDAIACRAILKQASTRYRTVWVGAKSHNLDSVRGLFADIPGVRVLNLGHSKPDLAQRIMQKTAAALNIPLLSLGIFGEGFLDSSSSHNFDESFYAQGGVSFSERVEGVSFPRDLDLERELEQELALGEDPFCFVHEDLSRGFVIEKCRLPENLRQVRSEDLKYRFPITAWVGVIMRAREIHVIESSFAALAESIDPPGKKVAHRYARSLVLRKPELEWTYQTKWRVET